LKMFFFKTTVIIFVYFATIVEGEGCDSSQQQSTSSCLQNFYQYSRSNEGMAFQSRYNTSGYNGLLNSDHTYQCTVINTLANCLKASNLTGCVTGPVFSSILSGNYSTAVYDVNAAKSMNCANNSRSILRAIQCPIASEGDTACMINTTYPSCDNLRNTLNCQLPKAKRECGLFAANYVCQNIAAIGNCGTTICNISSMDSVSMDKQMLYASGGRNTMSIILGLIIIAFSLNFW